MNYKEKLMLVATKMEFVDPNIANDLYEIVYSMEQDGVNLTAGDPS